eukprot:6175369-Pleurochrysis_carterae.AAC.1
MVAAAHDARRGGSGGARARGQLTYALKQAAAAGGGAHHGDDGGSGWDEHVLASIEAMDEDLVNIDAIESLVRYLHQVKPEGAVRNLARNLPAAARGRWSVT